VDCGLILNKYRALSAKWRGFLDSDLFLNGKSAWTESMAHGPWQCWSMVDRGQRPRRWLAGGWPEWQPGAWNLTTTVEKVRYGGDPHRLQKGRRRGGGDWAMVVKKQWRKRSVWAALGCREKRSEKRCDGGRRGSPFI
jgi:hypothetical protein